MKIKIFQKQLSREALRKVLAGGEGCTNVSARGEECLYPLVCGPYGCELSGNNGGGTGGGSTGGGGTGGGTGGGIGGPDPEQTT
ncbi:hypothetical protein [Chryseobacterium paridis]|uniref:Bacteriocin n=1 Tax=Chryseobacterium paridis TaxID=2800328 RepID=A0ABS1G0P9_9FLAO|nr:hypothetical protein [Chryseobacterium paridis]MBK1898068.1 hypothetical protein [Chryseobacterium paridis]